MLARDFRLLRLLSMWKAFIWPFKLIHTFLCTNTRKKQCYLLFIHQRKTTTVKNKFQFFSLIKIFSSFEKFRISRLNNEMLEFDAQKLIKLGHFDNHKSFLAMRNEYKFWTERSENFTDNKNNFLWENLCCYLHLQSSLWRAHKISSNYGCLLKNLPSILVALFHLLNLIK
jgi:hypothetical protein